MFHGRFVFYTSMPHAGATFVLPVLNQNPDICVIMLSDEFFFQLAEKTGVERTRQNGIRVYYNWLAKVTENINCVYPLNDALRLLIYIYPILCSTPDFPQVYSARLRSLKQITFKDIVLAVYYAKTLCEGKRFDEQFTVLVFDAHSRADAAFKHRKLIEQFDNVCFLTTIRNPLNTTASSIKGGHYCSKVTMLHLLRPCYFDYAQSFPEKWKRKFFAIRFEDGKLNPAKTFKTLSNMVGFKYSDIMLESDEEGLTSRGYPVRGFDLEPVKRSLNDVFSKSDIDYLSAVFEKLMLQYHYISSPLTDTCHNMSELFCTAYSSFNIPVCRSDFIEVLESVRQFSASIDRAYFFPKLIEV